MSDTKLSPQASQVLDEAAEIRKKKYEIDKYHIQSNHEELLRRKRENEINANINLDQMSSERVEKAIKENREYLEHAKTANVFINNDFKGKVPFFGRNLIFIAAKTGHGKTTIGKNIAFHTLVQNGRVLYATNEENMCDVYNGVTCLIKKWSYTNHENFTKDQLDEFGRMMTALSHRMMVVDDNYNGGYGQTTTLEGAKALLMNLHKASVHYDAIIIDYYQNISRSTERPSLSPWQCQEEFAKFLDSFKNTYLAPIIVLSQLKEGKDLEFKDAIEGRKLILNVATCAMKVTAEREFHRTAFQIEKSRFTAAQGDVIHVGFDRGKYVEYTDAFKNQSELERVRKTQTSLLSKIMGGKDEKK